MKKCNCNCERHEKEECTNQQNMGLEISSLEDAMAVLDNGAGFDINMMAKPIFFAPTGVGDGHGQVDFKSYDSDNEYYDEEITQSMMIRASGWPAAISAIAPIRNYNYMTSKVISDNSISRMYRSVTADTLYAVVVTRMNYFINNALSILINSIMEAVKAKFNNGKLRLEAPEYTFGFIRNKLNEELFAITKSLPNCYSNNLNTYMPADLIFRINSLKSGNNSDDNALYYSQVYASADILTMNMTATVANSVYNVLYSELTIFAGPDMLQELASELNPAFFGFRNTIRESYFGLFCEIVACDISIDPSNPYLSEIPDEIEKVEF